MSNQKGNAIVMNGLWQNNLRKGIPSVQPLYRNYIPSLRKLQRDYPANPYVF